MTKDGNYGESHTSEVAKSVSHKHLRGKLIFGQQRHACKQEGHHQGH